MSVVPDGWEMALLSDLCRIELGSTPARDNARLWDSERATQNVWLSISDMLNSEAAVVTDSREYVSDAAAKQMRLVPSGTLLVSFKLTLGRLCYAGRDLYTNEAIAALLELDHARLSKEYLYWYLTFFDWDATSEGDEKVKGRTLNKAKLKVLPIIIPPLDEQKRIVAVLDQAFAALDRARANAEANLADASGQFRLKVAQFFDGDNEPVTSVGSVCAVKAGSGFPQKDQGRSTGQYPFYKVSDMNSPGNEVQLLAANNYIDESVRKRLGASLMPVDAIAFPKVGGAIATNKKRVFGVEGCVDNNVMVLVPDDEKINPNYLHEWLRFVDIYEFSNKANPPSITQATVQAWPLALPDKKKQLAIVDKIQRMREATASLEVSYDAQLTDIATLRQSLLQAAFSGQLT